MNIKSGFLGFVNENSKLEFYFNEELHNCDRTSRKRPNITASVEERSVKSRMDLPLATRKT